MLTTIGPISIVVKVQWLPISSPIYMYIISYYFITATPTPSNSNKIIPKDDKERKEDILNKHFHGPEGIGKGQNNFHSYILSKYIGITDSI